MIKKIKRDLEWTLKLYSLTLVLPLTLSIMNILVGILGIKTIFGVWMNFKVIWIDYYFTSSFCNIDAWRWHLGLLFLSYLFTKFSD